MKSIIIHHYIIKMYSHGLIMIVIWSLVIYSSSLLQIRDGESIMFVHYASFYLNIKLLIIYVSKNHRICMCEPNFNKRVFLLHICLSMRECHIEVKIVGPIIRPSMYGPNRISHKYTYIRASYNFMILRDIHIVNVWLKITSINCLGRLSYVVVLSLADAGGSGGFDCRILVIC